MVEALLFVSSSWILDPRNNPVVPVAGTTRGGGLGRTQLHSRLAANLPRRVDARDGCQPLVHQVMIPKAGVWLAGPNGCQRTGLDCGGARRVLLGAVRERGPPPLPEQKESALGGMGYPSVDRVLGCYLRGTQIPTLSGGGAADTWAPAAAPTSGYQGAPLGGVALVRSLRTAVWGPAPRLRHLVSIPAETLGSPIDILCTAEPKGRAANQSPATIPTKGYRGDPTLERAAPPLIYFRPSVCRLHLGPTLSPSREDSGFSGALGERRSSPPHQTIAHLGRVGRPPPISYHPAAICPHRSVDTAHPLVAPLTSLGRWSPKLEPRPTSATIPIIDYRGAAPSREGAAPTLTHRGHLINRRLLGCP